jgi:hypothetical protein
MTSEQRELIAMALSRWKLARTIRKRLVDERCQSKEEVVASLQECISSLDNLRARIVAVLDCEQDRVQATEQLADTLSLSYLRSMEQCVDLISSLNRSR